MNDEHEDLWRKAIRNQDGHAIAQQLYDVDLFGGQAEIVNDISFDREKRLAIVTPSQYGKTWGIAAALGIYILLHRDKNVVVISGTSKQAEIMRNKFAEFLAECPPLADLVEQSKRGPEDLKKEASKERITFSNGCELRTLTAGGRNDAQSLMGFGADMIILDESNLVSDEIYEKRILRMLGNSEDATLVQIGNPTTRNHFYEACKKKDNYKFIHVDHEQAVEEGSFTQEHVDELREEMTDRNFKVNIMAEFPDRDSDNTLIQYSKLQEAQGKEVPECDKEPTALYGLDVARMGDDSTVLTRVERCNGFYEVTDTWKWDIGDTMRIANKVETIMNERGEEHVNVDTHGIGSGVQDRLNEKGLYSVGLKVGMSADNKDQFLRKKSLEASFNLRRW